MRTFATKSGSKSQSYPSLRSAPILAPRSHQSESSSEREASQAAVRVMSAKPSLREQSNSREVTGRVAGPPSQNRILPTAGQPLDSATRSSMESRFHYDFSRIRIHHDAVAEQAASSINARAFTHGRDIAFAKGQYAPTTAEGQHLLAHELAHTIQQAETSNPVIRRSANLHGATTFDERDSGKIDKVIAASPIKDYVDPKNMKTLAANVDQELPDVFADQFEKYGKSQENVDEIPGFVNRAEAKPIKLRAPGSSSKTKQPVVAASYEVAVHETVHLNSNTGFQAYFGHPCNEGVTEYFTEKVLGESGVAYRNQLALATGFRDAVGGEKVVGEAYFKDPKPLFDKASVSFGVANQARDFRNWKSKIQSDKPADWTTANQMLKTAIDHPAPPQAPPTATTKATPPPAQPPATTKTTE